jgi:hypothetical protein
VVVMGCLGNQAAHIQAHLLQKDVFIIQAAAGEVHREAKEASL